VTKEGRLFTAPPVSLSLSLSFSLSIVFLSINPVAGVEEEERARKGELGEPGGEYSNLGLCGLKKKIEKIKEQNTLK
jgi:hypothetical protein